MLCWHVTFKDHDNGRYTQRHAIHGKIVKRDPLLLRGTSARENPPNTGKVIIDGSSAQGWRTIKLPNGIAEARIILSEEDSRELLVTMIKDECIAIKTNPLLCSRQAEIKVGFQTTQNPASYPPKKEKKRNPCAWHYFKKADLLVNIRGGDHDEEVVTISFSDLRDKKTSLDDRDDYDTGDLSWAKCLQILEVNEGIKKADGKFQVPEDSFEDTESQSTESGTLEIKGEGNFAKFKRLQQAAMFTDPDEDDKFCIEVVFDGTTEE